MKTFYFEVTPGMTVEYLKKQYYKLAKIHHPDSGGSEEGFKAMNNEYEAIQKNILKGGQFTFEQLQNEETISEAYREIINTFVVIPGLIIEIVGTWVWIGGHTWPVKDQIKEAGFKWHSNKKLWYWHPGEYKRFNSGELSMEEIRSKYGSSFIPTKDRSKYISGVRGKRLSSLFKKLQKALVKKEALSKKINGIGSASDVLF